MKQGNPHHHAKLVIETPGVNPMSRMELVAQAEPRRRTTPVEPMEPVKDMRPGSRVGTQEEKDLRTGQEHPESRMGPGGDSGSADHRSIRQWSSPGSVMEWTAQLDSKVTQVAGSNARSVAGIGPDSLSASLMVNRASPC